MPGEETNTKSSEANNIETCEQISEMSKEAFEQPQSSLTTECSATPATLDEVENDLDISNHGIKNLEPIDESFVESVNTLDDISSLKTAEEDSSVLTLNDVDMKLSPSSLTEPVECSADIQAEEEEDETENGWVDVIGSGDLMKRTIKKGKGFDSRPQRGNFVKVRLIGRLENGDVVENETEKEIIVGDAEIIQGLDLIIPLMELHEICEVVIKPRLAYGSIGMEPDILPNATITYEIELLSVEEELDSEKMSFFQRKLIGDKKRDQGNFWYGRGEYSCALQCYRRALDFLDDSSLSVNEITDEQKELATMWMKVSNNMAAAQLKIGAFDAALKSVENVLKVQPKNVKALFRKAKILLGKGNAKEAVDVIKTLIELEPENKMFQQELSNALSKLKSEKQSERDMYRRMLGQDKQASSQTQNNEEKSARFLKWGLFAGALTAAVASVAAYKHFHNSGNY